ncbi:MAG: hybrid sensor histidine kinase/response regulator [Hyphomicrobiales bacterium]
MSSEASDHPSRVLVVDDDPLLREIVVANLRRYAFDVSVAENGREALDFMAENAVDIVISDLDMPVMTGYELLSKLRKDVVLRYVPVVVITGSEDANACERALSLGATAFLTKPLNWALFVHNLWYVLNNSKRENAIREARKAAEAASRMKDNMISVVSHELRTPLNSIIGFARLLIDEVAGPMGSADYRDYAREIEGAGRNMERLVSDLFLFSGILAGTQARNDDDYTVETLVVPPARQLAEAAKARGITLECVMDQPFAELTCDRTLVRRAITELVDNAIHAAPEGGKVRIEAHVARHRLQVVVTDNGKGLPEHMREQVFDPFFQVESAMTRQRNGLGLGLTVARGIARLHRGSCALEAQEGGGTLARLVIADASEQISIPERSVA